MAWRPPSLLAIYEVCSSNLNHSFFTSLKSYFNQGNYVFEGHCASKFSFKPIVALMVILSSWEFTSRWIIGWDGFWVGWESRFKCSLYYRGQCNHFRIKQEKYFCGITTKSALIALITLPPALIKIVSNSFCHVLSLEFIWFISISWSLDIYYFLTLFSEQNFFDASEVSLS